MVRHVLMVFLFTVTAHFAQAQGAGEDKSWKPGDLAKGKEKSATCIACHGANGTSMNPLWPNLCSQKAEYMFKQILDFKEDRRKDPTMTPMAKPLTIQDMRNLATFFASLKCN